MEKKLIKLFIATPAYSKEVNTDYVSSILNLISFRQTDDLKFSVHIHFEPGICYVNLARNNCVNAFLKSGCDKMLFVDSDISFTPQAVIRLLNFDSEIVITPYPIKGYLNNSSGLNFTLNFPDDKNIKLDKNGFCEISSGPTGFMMIDKSVFFKMQNAFPEKKFTLKHVREAKEEIVDNFNYFDTNTNEAGFIGEDIHFCNEWRKIGGKIYADTITKLAHHGKNAYVGNVDKYLENLKTKNFVKIVENIKDN
tara:strand:+ start:69 stop:824 length:756 start_codon:yes stop_codon:yes gene_type:complete